MRITVHTKPSAKHARVTRVSETEYEIAVTEHPEKGRATSAVRRALAAELGIAQSHLSLVMGMTSKIKIFEVI
jgi:uncharacterized protein YggU (UPF0235/DUF167 family)